MDAAGRQHLREMRRVHQRRLNELELQAAGYGNLAVPVHIVSEIKDIKEEIAGIDEKLNILAPSEAETVDVQGLLTAMGFRVVDGKVVGNDHYFLCNVKWGIDVRQVVVRYMEEVLTSESVFTLNDAVNTYGAICGFLLSETPLAPHLRRLIEERKNLESYTLDEFIDRLADFQPYLSRMIAEYESSDIFRYYIPLEMERDSDEEQTPSIFRIDTFLDDWTRDNHRNHITILGDFGVGKTWFCQHYTYVCAKRYLEAPKKNRVPILINLREYPRVRDVKQIITDVLINKYGINLPAGYETFDHLNKAGRILLILDGFDEMEQRISDYRATSESFWELNKVACPSSKVILTCRTTYFRHKEEERQVLKPTSTTIELPAGSSTITLQNRQEMEVIYLRELSEQDIKTVIQRRNYSNWQQIFGSIKSNKVLKDLAKRHFLLTMLIETISHRKDLTDPNLLHFMRHIFRT